LNPTWIEPPPTQRGMGCFAKGCLTLIAFFVFLGLAFIGGTYFAVRYLRTAYFPTTRVEVPAATATEEEQQSARTHWDTFERAARAHTPARIEMTADELNALIAAEPELRGKARVSITDNVGHLQVSVPLDTRLFRGHYINAECTVEAAEDGNPDDARLTRVVINGKTMPGDALNWRGPWSLHRYISDWTEPRDLKKFEIRDGKVILETRGGE
jgi:hypothetical protein